MKDISLGPLEQKVMNCIWSQDAPCTTRSVVALLRRDRHLAYNTVQTIMTRLVEKNLLKRELKGKTYLYQPRVKQKKVLSSLVKQLLNNFTSQSGEAALIAFVDGLDEISPATREKLIQKLTGE